MDIHVISPDFVGISQFQAPAPGLPTDNPNLQQDHFSKVFFFADRTSAATTVYALIFTSSLFVLRQFEILSVHLLNAIICTFFGSTCTKHDSKWSFSWCCLCVTQLPGSIKNLISQSVIFIYIGDIRGITATYCNTN